MKLNRTQALFLVGTIAAVGCVVENSDDGAGDDQGGGGSSGSGGSKGGSSGSSGSSGTYTGGTSGGGEGGATCMDETGPQVMCADFMEPGAGGVGAGGVGSGGEGYGGAAGGAGPSCEGMGYLQSLFCTDLWTNFKPGVANAARTCMNAQTPEELCTWDTSFSCAREAILGACPDPSADEDCEAIRLYCPDVTPAECSSVLSGMTETGRAMVVSCAAEALICDLWVCAGVASPAGE
jgi:hypothetical protein